MTTRSISPHAPRHSGRRDGQAGTRYTARRASDDTADRSRVALSGALLGLSMLAGLLGSMRWVHPAWSVLALGNYIWLCILFFRIEPRGMILALPHLISRASTMVALSMIEFGGEMFELGTVGRPGPWSNAMNVYTLLFCLGLVAGFKPVMRWLDRRQGGALPPVFDRFANLIAAMVIGLVALIAMAMIVRGLQYGFPLLAGIDRFHFRRFAADKVTLYALNLKFVIGYALGFVAFVLPAARRLRLGAGVLFAAMIVLYFLFGDKFFTQLAALASFAAPYLYRNHRLVRRRIAAFLVGTSLALSTVMVVTLYIYSQGFTQTSAATTKRLTGRMVGQGELWYLQASIGAPLLTWDAPLIDRYAASLSVKQIELFALNNSIGPNYFSNRYAPDYLRASLHRNAGTVTYTAATEPMGLVLFGWLGLGALMFLVGAVAGLSSGYIAYAIANRSIVSGLFAAYVYVQLRTTLAQAAPWVIASIYSMRWLGIILVIELALALLGQSARSHGRGKRLRAHLRRAPQPVPERLV